MIRTQIIPNPPIEGADHWTFITARLGHEPDTGWASVTPFRTVSWASIIGLVDGKFYRLRKPWISSSNNRCSAHFPIKQYLDSNSATAHQRRKTMKNAQSRTTILAEATAFCTGAFSALKETQTTAQTAHRRTYLEGNVRRSLRR